MAGFDPRVGTFARILAAVLLVQLAVTGLGLPGRLVISDLCFVVVSAAAFLATVTAVRRAQGRARVVWALLASTAAAWTVGNAIWFWYEVVVGPPVPLSAPSDLFYAAALVAAVVAAVVALAPLVQRRSGTVRVVLDVVMLGGSLLYTAWITVVGALLADERAQLTEAANWAYPALGAAAAVVSLAVMPRVVREHRLTWFGLGVAFFVGVVADTTWAYADVTGGYVAGIPVDAFWTASYGLVGLAALASSGDSGLIAGRIMPSRWEPLLAFVPVSISAAIALFLQLQGELEPAMVSGGVGLAALLVVRQLLFVLENHHLTRTMESRVEEATAELRAREEHFRSIVTNISDVVLILDRELRVSYQSPAAARLLGYEADALLGVHVTELAHPDDLAAARAAAAAQRLVDGQGVVHLARIRCADGGWRPMECTVTTLLDHPAVQGIVLALRDIAERVALQEELRHQAFHDSLTGLANRAMLNEQLDLELTAGGRPVLLLLDLDEFKAVNDTAGHDLGDDVLVAVAGRLLESTRPGDLVSRLGGDEFAIVLRGDPGEGTGVEVAERILQALRTPLSLRGQQIRCFGSIGVAGAGSCARAGADLLRDADVAMYVAKAKGKGRVECFTAGMREAVVRRQRVEELLRRAIADRRLVVEYQPVRDLATDRFVGAEALLRLRGDGGELVSPVEFVPVAESTGLIVEIGAWVLGEACRQAASWQELRPDGPPLDVSVNISTRQLQDPSLPRAVAGALHAAGLPAALLTLEITEGALANADHEVEATLRALRELGVRLSIDDFGAGYSSLGRLRHLPVDELKIDRAFVAELDAEHAEAPLIDAILAMAGRLGLSVVAEGIETDDQADYLRLARCDRGQGFLYARPLSAEAVLPVLATEVERKPLNFPV